MKEIIPSEKIQRISYLAQHGKSKSVRTRYTNELEKIYGSYQRTANRRLTNLRKEGYTYGSAYESAMTYIDANTDNAFGAVNFRKPKSLKDIEQQLLEISAFLRDPTSTVRYQRSREGAIASAIIGNTISGDSSLYEGLRNTSAWRKARNFLKFAGNETVSRMINLYENTDDSMERLFTIWDSDPERLNQVIDDFEAYQKNQFEGKSASDVVAWVDSEYENITRRRRR